MHKANGYAGTEQAWFSTLSPRHARTCRGHPHLACRPEKDLDGRDKAQP